jgi:tyrosyl-DNA phosphodiesterase-1
VQCSSIGKSLKEKFLNDICEGFGCKSNNSKVDIIYPTNEYVNSFPLGKELSGCLFLSKDSFLLNKNKFKHLEVIGGENKTIFHSKFIISCNEECVNTEKLSDNTIFYFGSHNLSAAAWGSYEKKNSQISISNYELGIIFDPIKLRYEEKQKILSSLLINVNSHYYSNSDQAFVSENF